MNNDQQDYIRSKIADVFLDSGMAQESYQDLCTFFESENKKFAVKELESFSEASLDRLYEDTEDGKTRKSGFNDCQRMIKESLARLNGEHDQPNN